MDKFNDLYEMIDEFNIEKYEQYEQSKIIEKMKLPSTTNRYRAPDHLKQNWEENQLEWSDRFRLERNLNKEWTRNQYAKMGINVKDDDSDELFVNVELPQGWKIEATDHSMWNNVLDEKGRCRISFFYKGSFYDRDAFSNFKKRYTFIAEPVGGYTESSIDDRFTKEWEGIIYDSGKEIYRTKPILRKDYWDNAVYDMSEEYLKQNYPLYDDINAYWEE